MWCNQFRSSLGVISVCWRRFNLQRLADIREILWSLQSFLLPKNEVDRKWVLQSFLSLFCFGGTSSNEPHSVRQCAKWVAWSKEHQETIKFGGLSTSEVVGGGGIGLVYIEIKAEKWETAVYILGGLFSVFPSTPRQRQSQELWKMQLVNGHGNVKQSFGPLWFTMQNCRFHSLTFTTQCLQYLKCTVVFKCYCNNMDTFADFQMQSFSHSDL